jgi:hypothetical protein
VSKKEGKLEQNEWCQGDKGLEVTMNGYHLLNKFLGKKNKKQMGLWAACKFIRLYYNQTIKGTN